MAFIKRIPVESSAAIPKTAQKIDLNGFWLNQDNDTVVLALSSETLKNRTPAIQAMTNFENKK